MITDKNSRNFSFPAQLFILLGLVGAGMVMATIVSMIIWVLMTGSSVLSIQAEMLKPENYYAMMAIQGVTTLFIFFLPVIFFAMICYRNVNQFIGFKTRISGKQILWVIAILILVFPLSGALAELNKIIPIPLDWEKKFKAWEESRRVQEQALININSFPKYIISLFIIALLPGIFEEVAFRSGLQNILVRWFGGPVIAIIVASVVFSAIHVSYYGFLVRLALGVILGLIYYMSGSIWLSVLFHFLFNGIQVTMMYVFNASDKINTKDVEQNFSLWWGPVAILLLIVAFRQFYKASKEVHQKFVYKEPDDPNDFHNWIAKN